MVSVCTGYSLSPPSVQLLCSRDHACRYDLHCTVRGWLHDLQMVFNFPAGWHGNNKRRHFVATQQTGVRGIIFLPAAAPIKKRLPPDSISSFVHSVQLPFSTRPCKETTLLRCAHHRVISGLLCLLLNYMPIIGNPRDS